MKVSIEQSGGFAGETRQLGTIDTEQLDPGAAQDVIQTVGELTAQPAQSPPLGSDFLRYTIAVSDGGTTRTIRFSDDGSAEAAQLMEGVSRLLAQSQR